MWKKDKVKSLYLNPFCQLIPEYHIFQDSKTRKLNHKILEMKGEKPQSLLSIAMRMTYIPTEDLLVFQLNIPTVRELLEEYVNNIETPFLWLENVSNEIAVESSPQRISKDLKCGKNWENWIALNERRLSQTLTDNIKRALSGFKKSKGKFKVEAIFIGLGEAQNLVFIPANYWRSHPIQSILWWKTCANHSNGSSSLRSK